MSTEANPVVAIKAVLDSEPAWVSGTLAVPAHCGTIFFKNDSEDRPYVIDTFSVWTEEMELLASACKPATFGRNREDVLDETYRKAGVLDTTAFASNISDALPELLKIIERELNDGQPDRRVRAERYKLNVYGEGAFFKPHKYTPRGADMFGSLVVVFPTPHTGGALVLRHDKREWTLDSGAELAAPNEPKVAYAAFFSNVEHEVLPVTSGHRVTITYNLYWDRSTGVPDAAAEAARAQDEATLAEALAALLRSPDILPEGGMLAFGLAHEYPVDENGSLGEIQHALKGPDALLVRALRKLGLQGNVMAQYEARDPDEYGIWMCDELLDFRHQMEIENEGEFIHNAGGVLITAGDRQSRSDETPIHWVTPVGTQSVEQNYVHYGNEATLSQLYAEICMVVNVRPAGSRG